MRFWDTSAIVPLCSDEEKTDAMNAVFSQDPAMIVSFITPVEVTSAITRKSLRDELLRIRARQRFEMLRVNWSTVSDFATVLHIAMEMAQRHALRGADAIQLASAIRARDRAPEITIVCNDTDLSAAARAEGFTVLS